MNAFKHLSQLIGATPLSKIKYFYCGEERFIYVKHEHYNYTGSIKDRIALHILHDAKKTGELKDDGVIVEATSGNTGISFAAIGRALGHKVRIFMPDWLSQERINLMKSFGAEVTLVSEQEGGFIGSINQTKALKAADAKVFLPSQFSNHKNCEAHYLSTGPEIHKQLTSLAVTPDAFIAGVGTGGTIMGVGHYLKEHYPMIKLFPLEPLNSPTLSMGEKVGKHRIQGISDDFIPDILKLDELDDIISVDDGDAIRMAKKLASDLGLGVGISSGANFLGAVKIQNLLGKDAVVVTILPDDNKKYLSTDLMKDEPRKIAFMSCDIDRLSFEDTICIQERDAFCKHYVND